MRSSIRVGKLFGVGLALDSSSAFLFGLISWSLSSIFQAWHPTWTSGTVLTVALMTGLAFFASLLIHELAHALVAKAYGLPVRDITLHLFGGVATIEREPQTPGAELVIALVGPIASVALGAAMLAIVTLVYGSTLSAGASNADVALAMSNVGPTETLLVWLGPVNIALGAFNLLPGFPMDGGRVLRAIVWKATGSLQIATRWSTSAGQALGVSFVVVGGVMALGVRVPFFGSGLAAGLWLAFIGMFLRGAAKRQQTRSDVVDALVGVPVTSLMRAGTTGVPANVSVRSLVDTWFRGHDEDIFPVIFGDRFVGVVSVTAVARVRPQEWDEHTAREIMRPAAELPAISPSDPAIDALRTLEASGASAVPVLDGGALVGMLFARDVARWVASRGATNDLRSFAVPAK